MSTPLQLSGMLKYNAQVRTHLSRDGLHESPALRLELEHLKGTTAHSITLLTPCTSYAEAEANAKHLLKGRVIRFTAPAEEAHMHFPEIREITIL
jgi:hypothetical protein